MSLTKSNDAVRKILLLLESIDVKVLENERVVYNGFDLWQSFREEIDLASKQSETEILDNLLILEDEGKIKSYLNWIDHRLEIAGDSIEELDICLIEPNYDTKKNEESLDYHVDYIDDLLRYQRGRLEVTEDIDFLSGACIKQLKMFLSNASAVIDRMRKFILKERGSSELIPNIKNERKSISSIKQQLLIMFFLNKFKFFRLSEVHDSMPKQAEFLQYLLNSSYDNTLKYLKLFGNSSFEDKYFNKKNLELVGKAFDNTKFLQIKEYISELITQSD